MTRTLVCIVSGHEGYGVRQVWSDLINGLSAQGCRVIIAVLDTSRAVEWKAAYPNATIVAPDKAINLAVQPTGRFWFYRAMAKRAVALTWQIVWLERLVRHFEADALLIQVSLDVPLAGIVARWRGVKSYWFVSNFVDSGKVLDFNRRIYRWMFRHLGVIPVSNSHYTDQTFGAGDFERHVVHLGVDTKAFRPGVDGSTIRARFNILPGEPVIGLFARMTAQKGQLRLIQAIAEARIDCHVLLCGGPMAGAYFECTKEAAKTAGLANRVHFAGFQDDLLPYYAACDIVTNLRDTPEAFGLTVVEAMACGRPVLAHALGGPSETIVDNETGWLIPGYQPRDIAAGLTRVFADRGRWQDMGKAARQRAEKDFALVQFVDKAANIVKSEKRAKREGIK